MLSQFENSTQYEAIKPEISLTAPTQEDEYFYLTNFVLPSLKHFRSESSNLILPNQNFMDLMQEGLFEEAQQEFLQTEYDPAFYVTGLKVLQE